MSLTNAGVYGSYGQALEDYYPRALEKLLTACAPADCVVADENERAIVISDNAATLNPTYKKILRTLLLSFNVDETGNDRPSIGCPMARIHGLADSADIKKDPHVTELLERGSKLGKNGSKQYLILNESPIASTLSVIADQLRRYQDQHGMPRVTIQQSLVPFKGYHKPTLDISHVTSA